MSIAILIGFSYHQCPKETQLPGIVIDLYQAYRFVVGNEFIEQIIVITDVTDDQPTSLFFNAAIEGIVDYGILSFIETIKEGKQHIVFESLDQLEGILSTNLANKQRVFFYYTGHFRKDFFILPNFDYGMTLIRDNLHLNEFRSILRRTNPSAEVFIIMDCCNGNGMKLLYKLQSTRFELSEHAIFEAENFFEQKIVCLSSTMKDQNSIATMDGSLFTRLLFPYLQAPKKYHLSSLLQYLNEKSTFKGIQTSTIYSSYPDVKSLWLWIIKLHISNELTKKIKVDLDSYTLELLD